MKARWILLIVLVPALLGSGLKITSEDAAGFSAVFQPDNPSIESLEGFSRTVLPDAGLGGTVGGPEYPIYRYLIAMPEGASADIEVDFEDRSFELSNPPYPRQPSNFKSRPAPDFAYDQDKYDNYTPPEPVRVEYIGKLRGMDIGCVEIRPVYFDIASGAAHLRERIDFEIKFDAAPRPPRIPSEWATRLFSHELIWPTDLPDAPDLPSRYLIITDSAFLPGLSEFIAAKERFGYRVTVALADTVAGSETELKNYVQNAYDTWDNPPDYLLLVGDEDRVPTHEYSAGWDSHPSDQFYAMLDGADFLTDIAVGRFSVSNTTELAAVVDKTLQHMKYEYTSGGWLDRIVLPACGTDGDYDLAMGTHRYGIDSYLDTAGFDIDTVFAYSGAGAAELRAAINPGACLVDYSGHGSETGWSNPPLEADEISTLTNDGRPPVVISNACLTNKFDHSSPCFGEAWIRETGGGAVAHIGGSNSTLWDEDDWWERAVFDAVFAEGYWTLASLMYIGNLEVHLRGSSEAEYYFQIYHVMGDPSLGIYWGEPEEISASLPTFFPVGSRDISLSAEESTAVSLVTPSGIFGAAYSSGSSADITLSEVPLTAETSMVALRKPNFFRPVLAEIPFIRMAAVDIYPDCLLVSVPDSVIAEVYDTLGDPTPGITVLLEGFAFADSAVTDAAGRISIPITPSFAETLTLTGIDPVRGPIFIEEIPVIGGGEFLPALVSVESPEAGITDSAAVGFDTEIKLYSSSVPYYLRTELPGSGTVFDTVLSADTATINVTPISTGNIVIHCASEGFAIGEIFIKATYCEDDFVGSVSDSSGTVNASGIRIKAYPDGADTSLVPPSLVVHTDSIGEFDGGELRLAHYDLYMAGPGWIPTHMDLVHRLGGDYDLTMARAPLANLSGTVSSGGTPIMAEVILFTPGGHGFARTVSDSAGHFEFDSVPYYEYSIGCYARNHAVYRREVEVCTAPTTHDIPLSPASATALVIDNASGGAADDMLWDIIGFGMTADLLTYVPSVDTMMNYEMVIYSSGGNDDSTVCSPDDADELLEARRKGAKILMEGGEVAYQYTEHAPGIYLDSLLMISGWDGDDPDTTLSLVLEPEGAYPLAHNPDTPPRSVPTRNIPHWSDYEYFDLVIPAGSSPLYRVTGESAASATYFADTPTFGSRRMVHFFFKYDDALTRDGDNAAILRNAVEWLRPPDFNSGILLGRAQVLGGNPADIVVTSPGDADTTAIDGRFRIAEEPGEFDLAFSASHVRDTSFAGIRLEPGEIRSGELFLLMRFEEISEGELPKEFSLNLVSPNPFNGSVAFSVMAPEGTVVELEIFDVTGRRVHREEAPVNGRKVLVWNTEVGIKLPSGVYFYNISAGDGKIRGKVMLIK